MIDYSLGVTLNPISYEHLPKMRAWRNDYRIRRWTRQNDLISTLTQSNWYERQNVDPAIRMYLVKDLNENEIGVCGLTDIDLVNRKAEFSLYIAPAFQGQGHGKKALKTLLGHGFNTYGLQVIWGETLEHNPAAKLFVDLGLRKEGVRRNFYFREGQFFDAHLYSILRPEWQESEEFHDCRTHSCST